MTAESQSDLTERFAIEVSNTGTVDHIVDVDAASTDQSPYSVRSQLPGEKLCDRSTRSPASRYPTLPEYAEAADLDTQTFDGDAPDEICSYCWTAVHDELEVEQDGPEQAHERIGSVGYRLRWKQKGRARDEWYDIVVRPATTIADVAERATLWEGDRLSMVPDFGTPSRYYCIVKDVYDPPALSDRLPDDNDDHIATTDTAAIVREKRPDTP
jgi:hypothetical protein